VFFGVSVNGAGVLPLHVNVPKAIAFHNL